MQNLMKQIVEIDHKAQEITNSAQQEKVDSEKEISKRREEIRSSYVEKAKKQIEESEPAERKAADEAWKEKNKKNEQLLEQMNSLYAEKGETWVSDLTKRIIGGIS